MEPTATHRVDTSDTPYLDITSNDFLYLMDKTKLSTFEVETLRYFINNLNSYFCFLGEYPEGAKLDSLTHDVETV